MRFNYEGHDARATRRSGVVEAGTLEEAAEKLRDEGVFAMDLQPIGTPIKAVLADGRPVRADEAPMGAPAPRSTYDDGLPSSQAPEPGPPEARVAPVAAGAPVVVPARDTHANSVVTGFLRGRLAAIKVVADAFEGCKADSIASGIARDLAVRVMVVKALQDAVDTLV